MFFTVRLFCNSRQNCSVNTQRSSTTNCMVHSPPLSCRRNFLFLSPLWRRFTSEDSVYLPILFAWRIRMILCLRRDARRSHNLDWRNWFSQRYHQIMTSTNSRLASLISWRVENASEKLVESHNYLWHAVLSLWPCQDDQIRRKTFKSAAGSFVQRFVWRFFLPVTERLKIFF